MKKRIRKCGIINKNAIILRMLIKRKLPLFKENDFEKAIKIARKLYQFISY